MACVAHAPLHPRRFACLTDVACAQELFGPPGPGGKSALLTTMEAWLRAERDDRIATGAQPPGKVLTTPSPFANSKHMAYFR